MKKPIFSIPAQGNFEQLLNGFYVQKLGYGEYHNSMSIAKLSTFLKKLPKYQEKLNNALKEKEDLSVLVKEIKYATTKRAEDLIKSIKSIQI